MLDSNHNKGAAADKSATSQITTDKQFEPLPPLQDQHGRTFDYVRIAVIEKCNLRYTYCMPEEGVEWSDRSKIMTKEEILRIVGLLARMGVRKVRFTGGEPTLRKDIFEIIEGSVATPGVKAVHLTTNALLLDRQGEDLLKAGLTGLNISLDTMNPDRFKSITRREGFEKTIENIQYALDLGFPRVKVNCVTMEGFNADEFRAFCEFTKDKRITMRFIEFMPFDANQMWDEDENFTSAKRMVAELGKLYPGIMDAQGTRTEHHIFQIPGYAGKVAVIPAFTRSLCGNCSRIRVTADGSIRNCLYSDEEFDLRDMMRAGCSDDEIVAKFRKAFSEKAKDGWIAKEESDKRQEHRISVGDISTRSSMTMIGG